MANKKTSKRLTSATVNKNIKSFLTTLTVTTLAVVLGLFIVSTVSTKRKEKMAGGNGGLDPQTALSTEKRLTQ